MFFYLIIGTLLLMIGFLTKPSYAAVGNFSVTPFTEEGEILQKGYYYYVGLPGESQYISLEIANNSDSEIEINMDINTAWTNQNGLPSYTSNEKKDESLIHFMEDLIEINEATIKIPAKEKKIVNGIIHYPKDPWQGQLLGGLRLTELNQPERNEGIENDVAYTIGVLLEMEGGEKIDNDFQMNKVTVDQRNYRTFIEMNLQNRAPKIVHNMNIVARVYKDGQSEPAYSFQTDNFRMAPNSNFNVGVPTGDIPILPGEYQAILEVTTDEKTYEFNKKFVINRKIANELNYSAVNINTQGYTWVYIAGCFLILIIFLIIVKQLQIKRRCSN